MIAQTIRPIVFAIACAGLMATSAASATDEPAILKICAEMDCADAQTLNLADLERMEQASFETSTIWTEGVIEFQGVPLSAFLEHIDFTSGKLEFIAANDYFIEIPVEEARDSAALIAYRMDGETMSTRDKGPLWLVYPFDSDSKYQTETYYSKSIWQIARIKVCPH